MSRDLMESRALEKRRLGSNNEACAPSLEIEYPFVTSDIILKFSTFASGKYSVNSLCMWLKIISHLSSKQKRHSKVCCPL